MISTPITITIFCANVDKQIDVQLRVSLLLSYKTEFQCCNMQIFRMIYIYVIEIRKSNSGTQPHTRTRHEM